MTPVRVRLPNHKTISLEEGDFVASGGEGSVFAKDGVAFKIFHDPTRALPMGKIQELGKINHPHVICPTGPLFAERYPPPQFVGHASRFMDGAVTLTEALTRSYRQKNALGPQTSQGMILDIMASVEAVHAANALIVDLGEMNMLLHGSNHDIYIIDTDSFQTPGFPARAIRERVRDPLAKKWSKDSDWYSFALLSFLIHVGIHPFEGKHPKGGSLETRMKEGRSVLDPGARMPSSCDPLTSIPSAFLEWYRAVFSNQFRGRPPSLAPTVVTPIPALITRSSQKCRYTVILRTGGEAIQAVLLAESDRRYVVQSTSSIWVDGKRRQTPKAGATFAVKTIKGGARILMWLEGGSLQMEALDGPILSNLSTLPPNLQLLMGCPNGRVLVRTEDTLYEVKATLLGQTLHVALHKVSKISRHTTRFRESVVVQNIAGTPCFMVFQGEEGQMTFLVPELAQKKVLLASLSGSVIGITTLDAKGVAEIHSLSLEPYGRYSLLTDPLSGITSPNFACLPNGLLIRINEEGEVLLSLPKNPHIRVIKDTGIDDMHILAVGSSVWGYVGDALDRIGLVQGGETG